MRQKESVLLCTYCTNPGCKHLASGLTKKGRCGIIRKKKASLINGTVRTLAEKRNDERKELVLSDIDSSTVSIGNTELSILYVRPMENRKSEYTVSGTLLHFHRFFELFFCVEGQKTVNTENGVLVLYKNDLCIIPPGVLHCRGKDDNTGMIDGISFNLTRKQGAELDTFSLLSHLLRAKDILVFRSEEKVCGLLVGVAKHGEEGRTALADVLFSASLLSLPGSGAHTEQAGTYLYDPLLLSRIEELIYNYAEKGLTLREAAQKLGLSERHLSRLIKQQYGTSFKKLTLKIRLGLAEKLLATTLLPASEIGTRVGFSDKDAFYRAFKKYSGVTTTEYRGREAPAGSGGAPAGSAEPARAIRDPTAD